MQQDLSLPRRLGLIAMDAEDLAVISANLQDAVVRVGDIAFLPWSRRFAFLACRFDWVAADEGRMERCQTGLHFDHVDNVALTGFSQADSHIMLNLLSILFERRNRPVAPSCLPFLAGRQFGCSSNVSMPSCTIWGRAGRRIASQAMRSATRRSRVDGRARTAAARHACAGLCGAF